MANALDRRKVTMVNLSANPDGTVSRHEAVDYVDIAHVDAYVADAKTRWQAVTVSETTDHGPGGADGVYNAPLHLL